MKTANAIVAVMKENGSDVIFGVPGGQTLFVTDAMREAGLRFIHTRHEGAAGHAADAWGRVTGTPGVCVATTGPGATNLLTPIGGAYRDSSPMIAMTFQNFSAAIGRGGAQEANHESIFSSIVKEVITVRHPDAAVWAMRRAYQIAVSGRPGPVVIDFYRDVIEKGESDYEKLSPAAYIFTQDTAPLEASLAKAESVFANAAKLCIYAGNGVSMAKAGEKVKTLAEKWNAPIVTSFNGIGSVPGSHKLVYGPRSRHGSKLTRHILETADCVLVLGSSMSAVSTNGWSLNLSNIVQVDFDSSAIAKQYPVSCGVVAGIGTVLEAFLRMNVSEKLTKQRKNWLTELDGQREAWAKSVYQGAINDSMAEPAAPVALMRELDSLLQDDTILCIDAGNPGAWSHLLHTKPGMRYMKPVNFGNMAFSLPAAIACSLANPERDVVCMLGDGSLGMSLAELETAARAGSNITILLNNDHAYGNIKQEELFKFKEPRYYGVDFSDIKFADIAKSMGCGAETIRNAAALKDAFARARAHKGPYMIEVIFDGGYSVWPEAF